MAKMTEVLAGGNRRRRVFAAVVGLALVVDIGLLAPIAAAATTAAQGNAAVFRDQANKVGAQSCANLYEALGQGLTRGAAFSVKTEADKSAPDAHIVQGVMGMSYDLPDLKGVAGGIALAAPGADGCEGYLVRVAPFQKPCAEVVSLLPAGSTAGEALLGVWQYRLGGTQGQALMIPSGSNCVVVTLSGMTQRK
ncbi:hypothetical protein [Caulobacter sp. BK020]|uniref:hypothetical protein n=1 Tax=Caulobacter sp. BK020 TaxID=2512117 RepID=UPI001049DC5D|nr:hypothetical protein [Caulobacter sp. BK020]TCS17501.1 hypothetical protein EV278_102265 [Caulobacter sp. BK020]